MASLMHEGEDRRSKVILIYMVGDTHVAMGKPVGKRMLGFAHRQGIPVYAHQAPTRSQTLALATGTGIHSSVAFCYQKIRKENGAVYTIIQNPDQLPENEHTKNIIANTDMLFVLPPRRSSTSPS